MEKTFSYSENIFLYTNTEKTSSNKPDSNNLISVLPRWKKKLACMFRNFLRKVRDVLDYPIPFCLPQLLGFKVYMQHLI